ncbi:MAG: NUDIX hydrolase [archaeon]|nr:NUDIX hydrolase [Nanoarchaeota archaeon]
MPAEKISLDKAKHDKLFYLVANVVIYREEDSRCLILKRHEREKVHPNKFCVPGGKLEWCNLPIGGHSRLNGEVLDYENAVEELLVRESLEEAGVELNLSKGLKYLNSVAFIRPDGIPVVLVKFAAKYKDGSVVLEEGAFTDHAWVNEHDVDKFDCIDGISNEVKETIRLFKKN